MTPLTLRRPTIARWPLRLGFAAVIISHRMRTMLSMLTPAPRPQSSALAPEHTPPSRAQRAGLLAIVVVGGAVRVLVLIHPLRSPGYVWEDPDGYLAQGLRLVG